MNPGSRKFSGTEFVLSISLDHSSINISALIHSLSLQASIQTLRSEDCDWPNLIQVLPGVDHPWPRGQGLTMHRAS
jgi:hypothetical protein